MPKKLHIGNAVLAEYVTQGNRNKHTLVNVYSGDVIVQEFPADLTFGLYVELMRPSPDAIPDEFEVALNFDGATIFRAMARMTLDNAAKSAVFMIPLFQVPAPKDGLLEIVITAKGFQKAIAISKRVFQDVFA